ncbi:MAG TPA: DUF5018 domain-containing protein [Gillisia sp.]|nr:DUF5018 domain-containing protein [Gillisia sp.]
MKKSSFKIVMVFLILWVGGCQVPEDLLPSVSREGINSITATFEDGTGEFIGYIEEGSNEIIIPIPYYYPVSSNNQVTEEHLSRMRVRANLDDNVTLSPALLYMDLTQENIITVSNQRKEETDYVVRAEIRKSSEAMIKDFKLPSVGLSGVINEDTRIISLVSVEEIEPALAQVTLSHHATISPDPSLVELDYNQEVELTVTAHDGVTQNVYTVKKEVPNKLPYGIRPGSGKLMFARQLKSDVGISVNNLTGGLAATTGYIVLNTRGENSVVLDAKSGETIGEIELGAVKGSLTNFYNTADDAGNIIINNLAPNAGPFKVWKVTGINQAPEQIIEWDGGVAIGRKLSIQGSLDGDAVITAPIHAAGQQFAKWTVTGGVMSSQTPEIVTMSGLNGWTANVDLVYTGTNMDSDYFVASYSDNTFAWVDGNTNTVTSALEPISANFIPNAVDYTNFNNAGYAVVNWVNSFTWGSADLVWLLDVSTSATFTGNLDAGTSPAVVWQAPRNTYGATAVSPVVANANGTGDVAITVSEDGYYLYVYFMFTNGYVVGYQFDAIDM